jgi:hypothetical protein
VHHVRSLEQVLPILFVGPFGEGLQATFGSNLGYNYLTFVFLGVFAQTLFQSASLGIISLLEDRENDFAQEIFISPNGYEGLFALEKEREEATSPHDYGGR